MELQTISKSHFCWTFGKILLFVHGGLFTVRESNFLVKFFWLCFLAFLGIWDSILLILNTEWTYRENSVSSPDCYLFFRCNPGNGSFPALFLPPGSSVSGKSLIDIKGKHPGWRSDCLGSAGLTRSSYRGACICPGPILVGLVGPVVPREKLGRVWEGWGEKPCKNLEEELGSSQTEWDSQKGSSPRGMLLGRVIEQNTRVAIKRSQA